MCHPIRGGAVNIQTGPCAACPAGLLLAQFCVFSYIYSTIPSNVSVKYFLSG